MTSKHQYQLDTEYRTRQMAQAEQARLAQEAQASEPKRNIFGAMVSKVQQIVGNRQQPSADVQPATSITDTQNIPAVS